MSQINKYTKNDCWIAYILPGGSGANEEDVRRDQEICLKKNLFGMGWSIQDDIFEKDETEKDKKKSGARKSASRKFVGIRKDDIVIMRLSDSHYYIGRAKDDTYINGQDNLKNEYGLKTLSCARKVKCWYDIGGDDDVLGCISGRFSIRNHPTIASVNDELLSMCLNQIMDICESNNTASNNGNGSIHIDLNKSDKCFKVKLHITENTFTSVLNASALEDLMYLYMLNTLNKQQVDVRLLPSSCKINRKKYEFTLVDTSDSSRRYTCQVKNRADVKPEDYKKADGYEKIFLFSGYWDESKINAMKAECENCEHIKIVSREELYAFIKDLERDDWSVFHMLFPEKYYTLSQERNSPDVSNWTEDNDRKSKKCYKRITKKYSIDNNGTISFPVKNCQLYYSGIWDCLIACGHRESYGDETLNEIEKELLRELFGEDKWL